MRLGEFIQRLKYLERLTKQAGYCVQFVNSEGLESIVEEMENCLDEIKIGSKSIEK